MIWHGLSFKIATYSVDVICCKYSIMFLFIQQVVTKHLLYFYDKWRQSSREWFCIYLNVAAVIWILSFIFSSDVLIFCIQILFQVIEFGTFVKHCKVEVYPIPLNLCNNFDLTKPVVFKFSAADLVRKFMKN